MKIDLGPDAPAVGETVRVECGFFMRVAGGKIVEITENPIDPGARDRHALTTALD